MDIDEFKRQFGLRIQSHRRRRHMTQEDLAEGILRSTDTVSNIERGINSTRIETAFRIAEVLDVPLVELFDVASLGPIDHERRHLIGRLLDLITTEDAEFLEAVVAQTEILLRIKADRRPS
jgi:transcriptional regulator with XRE-family HTH domain